jgi:hypothetical protein
MSQVEGVGTWSLTEVHIAVSRRSIETEHRILISVSQVESGTFDVGRPSDIDPTRRRRLVKLQGWRGAPLELRLRTLNLRLRNMDWRRRSTGRDVERPLKRRRIGGSRMRSGALRLVARPGVMRSFGKYWIHSRKRNRNKHNCRNLNARLHVGSPLAGMDGWRPQPKTGRPEGEKAQREFHAEMSPERSFAQ